MKVLGVIPARLGSTRLPNKVLLPIAGKPMLQRVWEQAKKINGLDELLIACDAREIMDAAAVFSGKAVLTRADHPNGTSRIAEVIEKVEADIIVNIQGDQPLLDCPAIESLAGFLKRNAAVPMATLAFKTDNPEDYKNPNVVKVVQDANGRALYFSRAMIPFLRDSQGAPEFWKHIGVYGYRREFLSQFVSWPAGRLEEVEKLEQLRVLERGYPIQVIETKQDFISVDTAEDLKQAEKILGK